MMKYKGYGNQEFEPGITIKEIADCLDMWNCFNVEQFNSLTRDLGKGYVIAPYGVDCNADHKGTEPSEEVTQMWRWIQNMDKAAYDTMNWLLRDKMVLLIIPPPPPPPPPGNGQ